MDLLTAFQDYLVKNKLLSATEPTLVAVSGGLDSVVLAHLFFSAQLPFGLAHCNFQLRGEESEADALFVQELAAGFNIPFFTKRFETTRYAEREGLSIQMAARNLRYAWFESIREEQGFGRIATAHQANDALETVLINFIRGTGLAGLTGIPQRNGAVIRPLLFATRAEIAAYATENNLVWREDRSNATDDYARNFIRHQIVPPLESLNPNFLATASRSIGRLRGTYANADFLLRQFLELADQPEMGFEMDKQQLARLPDVAQALHAVLKTGGFTAEQCRQLAENLEHTGLLLHSASGWQILNDRRKMVVSRNDQSMPPPTICIQADDLMVRLPDQQALFLTPAEASAPFPDGRTAILVDADKLQFPLLLRPWQPGDWFQPFGMAGQRQKLQDFLTNAKLSRQEKERTRVLENGDGAVIWVLGHRLDERFRILDTTSKALKINFLS